MSLLGSISTAVTGLTAQTACIGNISDNLANTTTTGFKSIGTRFQDVFSSADNVDSCDASGLGAVASPVYYNNQQGSISSYSSETYMAISGKGFFAVTPDDSDGTAVDTTNVLYTRCGDFSLDKDGVLTNSSGYSLLGWAVDPATGAVSDGALVRLQFSDFFDVGVVTTSMDYAANVPSSVAIGAPVTDSSTLVYDSKGYAHEVIYSWVKTDLNTWDLTVTAVGGAYNAGTDTETDFTAHATFVFDGSGPQTVVDPDGTTRIVDNTGHVLSVTSPDCPVTGMSLSYTLVYKDQDPLVTSPTALAAQTITGTFDQLTQFADTVVDVNSFSQDGAAVGSFRGLSIDSNGLTSALYDNGVQQVYYQIPLATFNSAENLQRMSGNVFRQTLSSGTPMYVVSSTEGAGDITVGALENSTVDIADQFSRMIQAQRAYAANAKTVSVADTMLQSLVTI